MNDYQLISFIPLSTCPIPPKTWESRLFKRTVLRKAGGRWKTICAPSRRIALSCRLWKVQGLGGVIAFPPAPSSASPGGYQCGLRKEPGTVGEGGRQAVPSKLFLLPFLFFNFIFFFSVSKGCRAEIIYFGFE